MPNEDLTVETFDIDKKKILKEGIIWIMYSRQAHQHNSIE